LREIAKVVRSKNAGPFEITLDVIFKSRADFDAVKESGVITRELISELYNVPTQAIITFGFFDLVNAVTSSTQRRLDFVSFTVPQDRDDRAYFEPLCGLGTGADTELNFAVVPYHRADQAAGTTDRQIERIDAALGASAGGAREWGICTECGMGRVDAPDVPGLLDLHRRILASSR